jgi:hypothetical protein
MKYKGFVIQSKKSKNLFHFIEYTDDGWGAYHDDLSPKAIDPQRLPTIFPREGYLRDTHAEYLLKDHSYEEIDYIPITIEIGTT